MRFAFVKKKFSVHGGAERYLQTFLSELRKGGHEIHILASAWSAEPDTSFHRVPVLPLGSMASIWSFNRNLQPVLRRLRADCTVSFERTEGQDIYRAGEGCHAQWLEIRRRYETPLKRASFAVNPLHRLLLSLEGRLFRDTPLIIANSRMVKEQIIRHYRVPQEKIAIVYNGVDLSRFSPDNRSKWRDGTRKELGIGEGERAVLFVGSGFARKGLPVLARAVARLEKLPLKLMVAGRGEIAGFEAALKGKLIYLGTCEQIEKYYAAADLFVLPTLYDPFSNATLEALASGLPVLTTRSNGVAELLTEGEGDVLEDPFDGRELAEKLEALLPNLETMGEKARRKGMQFPIGRATEEFVDIIRQRGR